MIAPTPVRGAWVQALWSGLLAGALGFLMFFPPQVLIDPGAMPPPPLDWAMTLSGALSFVRDDWHWPVFAFEGLTQAHETNAVFTDSIPLFSLIWKAATGGSEAAFGHFLPAYLLTAFLFQGAAGALALRLLGVEGRGPLIFGALLIALFPAFLLRLPYHLALSAHGFVVLALAMLFSPPKDGREARRLVAWAVLLVAAVLTHAYLFAMAGLCFALSLAIPILTEPAARRGPALGGRAAGGAAVAGLVGAAMWVAGYFTGAPGGAGGFGHYSASLATFFIHHGHSVLPQWLDFAPGQREGFAYLPIGLWLVLVLALLLRIAGAGAAPAPLAESWRRAWPVLALAALGVVLIATAGRFTWGERDLLALDLPGWAERAGAVFRSSGRFIWLIGYGVVLLGLARLARGLGPRASGAVFAACAVAVVIEMQPVARVLPPRDAQYSGDAPLEAVIADADSIAVHPPWPCGGTAHDPIDKELQWLAAKTGAVLANTLAAARLDVDCATPLPKAFLGVPGPGRLLIVKDADTLGPVLAAGAEPDGCRGRLGMALCRAAWETAPGPPGTFAALPPPARLMPGEHPMAEGGSGTPALGQGFSRPEPWGVWSIGREARLEVFVDPEAPPRRLGLALQGYVPEARPAHGVRVTLESRATLTAPWHLLADRKAHFRRGKAKAELGFEIPPGPHRWLRITLRPSEPVSPAGLGLGADDRDLGVGVLALTLGR